MKTYVIADTHFNHSNIIKYGNRPFNDVLDMNKKIIDNWNQVVQKEDIVYHLGDFFLGSKKDLADIVSKLNGKIYLIRGNHDRLTIKAYEECGIKVLKNAPIILEDYKVLLSHRPLPDSVLKNYLNIHGHIHERKIEDIYDNSLYDKNKHINVSCDVLNFKPILINKLFD